MTLDISERRRREVVNALRGGTVPQSGLDVLAVGLGRFESAIDAGIIRQPASVQRFLGSASFQRPMAERIEAYTLGEFILGSLNCFFAGSISHKNCFIICAV